MVELDDLRVTRMTPATAGIGVRVRTILHTPHGQGRRSQLVVRRTVAPELKHCCEGIGASRVESLHRRIDERLVVGVPGRRVAKPTKSKKLYTAEAQKGMTRNPSNMSY